jgi:hypothetical protein
MLFRFWGALVLSTMLCAPSGCRSVAGYDPAGDVGADGGTDLGADQRIDTLPDLRVDAPRDQRVDRRSDQSQDQQREGLSVDRGVDQLPDGKPVPDVAAPDAPIAPDGPSSACADTGRACSVTSQCDPGSTCLKTVGATLGVCGCPCTPDDQQTPLVNEDSCPDLSNNVCGWAPNDKQSYHCYRQCAPKLGTSSCAAGIACHPASAAFSGKLDQAVCAFPMCTSDTDCPVSTDKSCPCGSLEWCHNGRCAKPGSCDLGSGLCKPRSGSFNVAAKVGDPCTSDKGCGAAMRCERERPPNSLGKLGALCASDGDCCSGRCSGNKCTICVTHARGGYCVVDGCTFASTLTAYACPLGSTCYRRRPGGWCLKTCDLTAAKDCRGVGMDKNGDYECRAWNNLSLGAVAVSDAPVCDFGESVPCDLFSSLTCDALGLIPGNSTQMECRAPATNVKLVDKKDPNGFCLDTTKSGP